MNAISVKNEFGETIEIQQDADGVIKLRHADIDPKRFGVFHEYSKRSRQPEVAEFLKTKGFGPEAVAAALASPLGKVIGGYVVIRGQSYIINAQETALIYDAIKRNGGIVPNWDSGA
jgi:hypothetical protein